MPYRLLVRYLSEPTIYAPMREAFAIMFVGVILLIGAAVWLLI
jgi:hypothetical protein